MNAMVAIRIQTSLTGGKTRRAWTRDALIAQARQNCIGLVKLYNAHAYVGEMQNIAEDVIRNLTIGNHPDLLYGDAEAQEMLAAADAEVREYLDD